MKKVSIEKTIKLSNINIDYGSMDKIEMKSIFIEFSGWLTVKDDEFNISRFEKYIRERIRSLSEYIHPNVKYSIVVADIPENINKSKIGFVSFELTCLNTKKICDLEDTNLIKGIIDLGELIQSEIQSYQGVEVSLHRPKKGPNLKDLDTSFNI